MARIFCWLKQHEGRDCVARTVTWLLTTLAFRKKTARAPAAWCELNAGSDWNAATSINFALRRLERQGYFLRRLKRRTNSRGVSGETLSRGTIKTLS